MFESVHFLRLAAFVGSKHYMVIVFIYFLFPAFSFFPMIARTHTCTVGADPRRGDGRLHDQRNARPVSVDDQHAGRDCLPQPARRELCERDEDLRGRAALLFGSVAALFAGACV